MAELKDYLLVEYIANNKELYVKTMNVLRPEFFEEPAQSILNVVHNYYEKYHALPHLDIVEAETDIRIEPRTITKDQFDYTVDEIEEHCKNAAVRNAILESADLLDTSDFGQIESKIRDALMVSVQKSLGINLFENPKERLLRMQEKIDERTTGYTKIDELIGKIRRGETLLLAAGTAGGKSVFLANLANNFAADGLNGVIISLELNEELVSKRLDSIVTGIHTTDIFSQIDKVVTCLHNAEISYGSLITKKLPGGSRAIDIRAYLMEYELTYAQKPDFVIVDYQDLMKPNENLGMSANAFDKDKAISEELRDIWVDYNCYGITASQLNRCHWVYDTVITDTGTNYIGNVEVGDKVKSHNGWRTVNEVLPKEKQQVYRVTTKSGKVIHISANHKIPTKDGLKTINSGLSVGDKVYSKF